MSATVSAKRTLTVEAGTVTDVATGTAIALSESPMTVGRGEGSALTLDDPTLSERHCDFTVIPGRGVRLRDLGSSNGTYYMGALIEGTVWLRAECEIGVGGRALRFVPERTKKSVRTQLGDLETLNPRLQMMYERLSQVVNIDVPIHLTGDSGSGKEILARALHQVGDRAKGPFVVVDVSQVAHSLAESALFGHAKGSFTGATREKSSPFEDAKGGVAFIDEVGHLHKEIQQKLLRVIEAREVYRVGENFPRKIDCRIVSASRHDLNKLVNEDRFQVDVHNRLAGMVFELPPLRQRLEDMEILSYRIMADLGKAALCNRIADWQFDLLRSQKWDRGNMRQLRQVLTIACGLPLKSSNLLDIEEAIAINLGNRHVEAGTDAEFIGRLMKLGNSLAEINDEVSRLLYLEWSRLLNGNQKAIGSQLGLGRTGLYDMRQRLGLIADGNSRRRAGAPSTATRMTEE